MKKLFFLAAFLGFAFFVQAQTADTKMKTEKTKTVQSPAPAKMSTDNTKPVAGLKDHVCTDKCKDGNHMYVHGEKGHTCDKNCTMMSKGKKKKGKKEEVKK